MHDDGLEFRLPGGLVHEGNRHRFGRLRPLTGRLELALAPTRGRRMDDPMARIERVDEILAAAVLDIGEHTLPPAWPSRLSEGDRDFLIIRLAASLYGPYRVISMACHDCAEVLDIELELDALPVVEAPADFPRTELDIDGRRFELRAPVSADLAALGELRADAAARALLDACVVEIDGQPRAALDCELGVEQLERIDAALDELCPAVASTLEARCPSCDTTVSSTIDPLELLVDPHAELGDGLLEQIHALAMNYHWSESELLDLPRARRLQYLRLIDLERGMLSEVPA